MIKIDHRWIERQLRKAARRLIPDGTGLEAGAGRVPCEVSVLLVNDRQMRDLNLRYRGLDKTTDVLSFPQTDAGPRAAREERAPTWGEGPVRGQALLGDIVINLHQAGRESAARKITLKEEVSRLLVHGLLHLLGYDHERGGSEGRRMRATERKLLGAMR